MFYFDPYYLYLIIPALIISMFAQYKMKATFKKYSQKFSARGYTGAEVARQILDKNGLHNVSINRVAGKLTDHFDPRTNSVSLSEVVYSSNSIASIGVAAHEVGHAIQYATSYSPIKIRKVLIPAVNLGSKLAIPLAMIGLIFNFGILLDIGIILFSAVVVFQLVTLPVEFNASNRAISTLEENHILKDDELKGARKVLSAAAMTYVAATLTAIASLVRLILLRRRNDN